MPVGHAHSHRPRRATHQTRDVDLTQLGGLAASRLVDRAQRRQVRIERRRQQLAAGPREVIVQVPVLRERPPKGQFFVGGGPSRWVREALVRQMLEAARQAAEATT